MSLPKNCFDLDKQKCSTLEKVMTVYFVSSFKKYHIFKKKIEYKSIYSTLGIFSSNIFNMAPALGIALVSHGHGVTKHLCMYTLYWKDKNKPVCHGLQVY